LIEAKQKRRKALSKQVDFVDVDDKFSKTRAVMNNK